MAIEELGAAKVFEHVGVEPSGEPFNSIELQLGTNRPFNPMVNAGAIAVTALLHASWGARAADLILSRLSAAAGHQLKIDQDVYASEVSTGHRNRAIAYLLLVRHGHNGPKRRWIFISNSVPFGDLPRSATMAATLSNMGRNPHRRGRVRPPLR